VVKENNATGRAEQLCNEFKQGLSIEDVRVHLLEHGKPNVKLCNSLWANVKTCRDTVSSVGVVRSPTLPETTSGMQHVCVFRHALALDERRVKFLPEFANGGAGPLNTGNVKEVWFAGVHADM
jgi:uncharacterized protein (DUF2235 family)